MMIKTGARAVTPKVETPPVVIPYTPGTIHKAPTAPDPFDSPSYKDMPAYVPPMPEPEPFQPPPSTVTIIECDQGTPEWFDARAGIVTASVLGMLISKGAPDALTVECPKCEALASEPCVSLARKDRAPLKTLHDERTAAARDLPPVYRVAEGEVARGLIATLAAERITNYVEPMPMSRDMERGTLDEPYARDVYSERYAPVTEVGFMVRDYGGYRIGYSPDGLVAEDGLIEIKSRKQKIQLRTFLDDTVPAENMAQIQCGLLVSGREWLDYVSYNGGMPPYVKRVDPDPAWHQAIHAAVVHVEASITDIIDRYLTATEGNPPTERIDHWEEQEIF